MIQVKGYRRMSVKEVLENGYIARENGLVLDEAGTPLDPPTYVDWGE
jgi:hypothetical protein